MTQKEKKIHTVKKAVERYLEKIEGEGIRVRKAYLYGSYARGDFRRDSDIDVCVIAENIRSTSGKDWLKLAKARWDIDLRIEPIGYSVEEFEEKEWLPLIHEIQSNGVRVR
jgi:predicted nucleotidyltransferase